MGTSTLHNEQAPGTLLPAYKLRGNVALRAALGLLVALAIIRFPALRQFTRLFSGGFDGDTGLYIWLLRTLPHDLLNQPWFSTFAFYPYGRSLAWSDNFILPALVAWPFLENGAPIHVVWNALLLLVNWLTGYSTFLLCYRLSGNALAAFVGGAAFMTLSFFSANLGHPQMQYAFWLPLALLALVDFLNSPSSIRALLPSLAIGCAFLCAVYFAVFGALLLICFVLALLILQPSTLRARTLFLLAAASCVVALAFVPFVLPYLDVRAAFGQRGLHEAHYFSTTILSFFSASPYNFLYNFTAPWSHAEAHFFPGFISLALAFLAVRRCIDTNWLKAHFFCFVALFLLTAFFSLDILHGWKIWPQAFPNYACSVAMWGTLLSFIFLMRRLGKLERTLGPAIVSNRDLLAAFLFDALFFFLLSLGPQGNPAKGHIPLGIYTALYEILPGIDALRAVSRAGIVVLFCLIVSGSLVLAHYLETQRFSRGMALMLLVVLLAENFNNLVPLQADPKPPLVFEYAASLSSQPGAAVVLPYAPRVDRDGQIKSWTDFATANIKGMYWAAPLNRRLVNGYSGQRSQLMLLLASRLKDFPDSRSLRALGSIAGLRYIFFLPGLQDAFDRESFSRSLAAAGHALSYLYGDNDGNMLFEYAMVRQVNAPGFHLLAPADAPGTLTLELMAEANPPGESIELKILTPDPAGDKLLSTLRIPRNGEWQTYGIPLPARHGGVSPHRLLFQSEANSPVFVRASSYEH